ncbi:UDP-glucose 4-epimerase [Kocuria rhizophila]|uniref:UDP-glucose 4-epimerase n=1 Tax=Kocuria rhizophila (strain ATCC 9341 / DSM 348 / NBRC 103217 / DC2201) TaxID=378753 RepID=B2GKP5_KOCRD|nr:UDP-glucose 4-epimerase GalE [Kocuria rhizophila]HAG63215.1 UDP-glucose 4-epimerase GalE [Kocuria sp.]ASE12297.1 UDP-glucose 4-epimerase GalE [Kocuria rhizophila]MBK4120330.1 UDP-glucose 4-epimerase GalE [Kocuria rhizophila]MCC5672247.1 UDP-glucose 4-epimerase GalE [Kocuria rhizophila]MCC5674969.1 UDP-glucose 4-epimerase GalE [Kocuria rhizophila]
MKILVTGGTGYIGSHTVLALLEAGHDVVVLDNLSNSSRASLERVAELAGRDVTAFEQVDLLDRAGLDRVFREHRPEAVIHFAGLKAVGESAEKPLWYYTNNVSGTVNLLWAMEENDCRSIVFSSSATVYGAPETMPLTEKLSMDAQNPYGRTKEHIEDMLADLAASDERWSVALLRYFNPVGAHESGRIGEDPSGIPNNLMPFVAQVAVGRREKLMVFGDDYPTPDGTGVRDYIHVVDLADGHLKALDRISEDPGVHVWNLGTGRGYSVLEVREAFQKASGREIPYEIAPRRPGDAAVSYADPASALAELGWSADRDIDTMCRDHWNWQKNNPNGYEG